jgi:lipoprotein-anchoring transpeptidase ErfK/SrfK
VIDKIDKGDETEVMKGLPGFLAAATVAVAVGTVVALSGCRPTPLAASAPGTTAGAASSGPSASAPRASAGTPSAHPPASTAIPAKLRIGSSGPAVTLLQQKLTALGYWLGPTDGSFGGTTQQAVYALQKAAGQKRTGVVTSATWNAIDKGVRPTARSRTGQIIEVDLKRDLLLFVSDGHVRYILNTSTGGGYVFYEEGRREVAITPKGHFTTYRVIDAPHRSPLGLLYRPRYFVAGVAIHGDSSVPAHPVSHGCVRVSNAAINWIWAQNLDPIGRTVWTY